MIIPSELLAPEVQIPDLFFFLVYSKSEIDKKLEDLRVFLQDVLFQKLEILESKYNRSNSEDLFKAFLREGLLSIPENTIDSITGTPLALRLRSLDLYIPTYEMSPWGFYLLIRWLDS